jgi:hypothetical protein
MSAWQIPLSVQSPNIQTPQQVQGQQLSLQQLAGQVGIQKQVQAENALKIQAAQEDQNDQNTIQQAFHDAAAKNPGGPIDYQNDIRGPLASQIRLRNLQGLDADHMKMQQAAQDLALSQSTTDKLKFDNLTRVNTMKGQLLSGMLTANDQALKQNLYTAALPKLKALGEDVSQYPAQYPGDDAILAHAAGVGYGAQILTDADAFSKSKEGQLALAGKQRAQAVQDYQLVNDDSSYQQWKAAHPGIAGAPANYDPTFGPKLMQSMVPVAEQPEYQIKSQQAKAAAAMTPATIAAQVNGVIDPNKYPAQNARARAAANNALANGMGLAGVNAAIKDNADSVQAIEKEVNPAVINAHIATAYGTQRALNASSNAALANVPPHLVAPASADYTKVSNEYADAVSAADNMKSVIDSARSGNKLAYSYDPTMGVLSINSAAGVKRINMTEVNQYGGAGSAADRIQGWLGKQVSGKSIPDNILDDMESMHSQLADNAATKYNDKVGVVNQAYGASFKPAAIQPKFKTAPLTDGEAKSYLKRVGWKDGTPPTQVQKGAAAALANKEGRTF